jgi:RHS repeat-associated protein
MRDSKRATRCTTVGLALVVSACLAVITKAQTQTAARPDRGLMPAGSYSVSDIENISLTSGNLNLSIPLASLPPMAGGKLSLTLRATYNSKLWNVARTENQLGTFAGCGSWVTDTPQVSDRGGWTIGGGGYALFFRNAHEDFDYAVPNPPNGGSDCEANLTERVLLSGSQWYKLILLTPDGAEHEMRPLDKTAYEGFQGTRDYLKGFYRDTPATTQQAIRYYSTDGTYLWATVEPFPLGGGPTSWTIYTADGTKITQSNGIQRITDNNGNSIKIYSDTEGAHYQDEQTGREIKVIWSPTVNNGKGQTRVWYQVVGGDWKHVDINHDTVSVQGKAYTVSAWNPTGGETGGGGPCTMQAVLADELPVIREIVFPETVPNTAPLRYHFSYNSEQTEMKTDNVRFDCYSAAAPYTRLVSKGTGELSQMVTPSGATINYTYNFDSTSYYPFDSNDLARMMIASKSITHDGATDTWTYNISPYGSSSVTNPDGSTVGENFYPLDPAWGRFFVGTGDKRGLTYRTSRSGKVMVERHWTVMPFTGANTNAPGGSIDFNPVVDAEYTTLMEPNPSGTPTPVKMSAKTFQYDYNGNLLETKEYDWFDPNLVTRDSAGVPTGIPASAVLLRTTTASYHNAASSASSANVYAKRAINSPYPLILDAPLETIVGPGQTRFSYDGQDYGVVPTLGNLTRVSSFDDQGDTNAGNDRWLDTVTTYDSYGNKSSVTDPKNHVVLYECDNPASGLVNRIKVNPLNGTGIQTTTTEYDPYTGLVKTQYDANGNFVEVSYINQLTGQTDPFGRPGVTSSPAVTINGVSQRRKVATTFEDHLRRVTVASDLNAEGDGLLKSRTTHDQLGRIKKVEQSEDGSGFSISSETVYEEMGRIIYQSNTRRAVAADTDGWARSTKDALGRVVEVASFTGPTQPLSNTACTAAVGCTGVVSSAYYANQTTVTDQAGRARKSETDALGRLIKIYEDPQGLNYETSYSYDVLGNLTGVTQNNQQAGQGRAFTYSSLSRLSSAQNPESGTIRYEYDANGNLSVRTDARGIVTSYGHDGLNRVVSRTYSDDTPAVTYVYDTLANGKGRLTSVSSAVSVTSYTGYDAMGRATGITQVTDGHSYSMPAYRYDLAGNLSSQQYPSGRVVSTSYDNAGRFNTVTGQKAGEPNKSYATSFSYTANGTVSSVKLGNNLWEHTSYNSRLQPVEIGLGTSATDSSVLKLSYSYGVVVNNAPLDTTKNNGNPESQTITGAGLSLKQTYSYDALDRLKSFSETGGLTQTYDYDRWGNRAVTAGYTDPLAKIPTPTSLSHFNSNNRIKVYDDNQGYDAAGNLKVVAGHSFAFDAENRMTAHDDGQTVGTVDDQYAYDGDGKRVKKVNGTVTTIFVYNILGQLVAEYTDGSGTQNSGTSYFTPDHLGTPRVMTKGDGGVIARHDYLPFGEEIKAGTGGRTTAQGYVDDADGVRQKFTQKERDVETGLDYFGERYYSNSIGRFISVDPLGASAKRINPQTMNRYSYVFNNPLRYVDPYGMDPWDSLTKQEKELIQPKLRRQGTQTIREAFNNLVRTNDDKGTEANVQSLKNFIAAAGGYTNSAVWQQIQYITRVTYQPGTDPRSGQQQSSVIDMQIADRGKFLDALKKEGYDVNGWGDTGRKIGQTVKRNLGAIAEGIVGGRSPVITNPPDHAFDNARARTWAESDPQLHLYNDSGGNAFQAHWDWTSSNAYQDGPIGNIAGGWSHGPSASPQRVNQYLKEIGKAPK